MNTSCQYTIFNNVILTNHPLSIGEDKHSAMIRLLKLVKSWQ